MTALCRGGRDDQTALWTARALAYRLKNQIDQERAALAVVVPEGYALRGRR